ncbi:hypothetical protein SELMODRAFT_407673 [Selaginella moellendorffii]|uniref:Uncharacterized protein n=1 Tax=Selaginella moellendorffii TaxID=88036 RepID=D8R6D8_SELML|nr:hypothetical protein SELMODRAFT_407673 [Selaginella moellendorffii]
MIGAVFDWFGGSRFAQWELVDARGPAEARKLHGAAVVDTRLYVVGGELLGEGLWGRYTNDVQLLDLGQLEWSSGPPLPVSCAGHSLIVSDKTLIALVGIPSDVKLRVYKMDTTLATGWSLLATSGEAPVATRGHSASMIDNKTWVFGGETFCGDLCNGMHILDLNSNKWEAVNSSGCVPCPRSFHGVAVSNGGLVYLFGGRIASGFCQDVYVLDPKDRHWSPCSRMLKPGACFGNAVVGDECYFVGGKQETFLFNMKTLNWTLVAVEPRLATEGLTLVHARMNSQDTLIALWGAEFGVFMMKTMSSYRVPLKADTGLIHVREADGSVLGVFSAPDVGKPAVEIIQALHWQTGQTGGLMRAITKVGVTGSDLVYPGEELIFCAPSILGRGQLDLNLQSMDVKECEKFLSQMKIKVISGQGWLEPSTTIQAEAFSWKPGTRKAMIDRIFEYLDNVNVLYQWSMMGYQRGKVEKISSSSPFPYKLTFQLPLELRYYYLGDLVAVALWVEQEINDKGMWKALVSLLALNIKNHTLKPWMVITDLKEEWHFAWMDGACMFVCKARGRYEGLGILYDLHHDYDKTHINEDRGPFSSLPTVFTRDSIGLTCDTSHKEVYPVVFPSATKDGEALVPFWFPPVEDLYGVYEDDEGVEDDEDVGDDEGVEDDEDVGDDENFENEDDDQDNKDEPTASACFDFHTIRQLAIHSIVELSSLSITRMLRARTRPPLPDPRSGSNKQ